MNVRKETVHFVPQFCLSSRVWCTVHDISCLQFVWTYHVHILWGLFLCLKDEAAIVTWNSYQDAWNHPYPPDVKVIETEPLPARLRAESSHGFSNSIDFQFTNLFSSFFKTTTILPFSCFKIFWFLTSFRYFLFFTYLIFLFLWSSAIATDTTFYFCLLVTMIM